MHENGAVLEVPYHYSTASFFLLSKRFVLCHCELVVIFIMSSELDGSIKKVRWSMGDKSLSAIGTTNSYSYSTLFRMVEMLALTCSHIQQSWPQASQVLLGHMYFHLRSHSRNIAIENIIQTERGKPDEKANKEL